MPIFMHYKSCDYVGVAGGGYSHSIQRDRLQGAEGGCDVCHDGVILVGKVGLLCI